MSAQTLTSDRVEVDLDLSQAIEACYERGWTDGLPVVPASEARGLEFLEVSGDQPADVIGVVETRGRVITAEKIAINAVMAGCLPEYMPVVKAIVQAMTPNDYRDLLLRRQNARTAHRALAPLALSEVRIGPIVPMPPSLDVAITSVLRRHPQQ